MNGQLHSLIFFVQPVSIVAGIIILGLAAHAILYFILKKIAKKTGNSVNDAVVERSRGPARLIVILFLISFFAPVIDLGAAFNVVFEHLVGIAWVLAVAWLVVQVPEVVKVFLLDKFKIDEKDNLKARKIITQFNIFHKIVVFIVIVLAFAFILMDFDKVRSLGASILASAGIIGIIAGFAGQKLFANIFAGLQIAVTQPFRIDDVVIIENEWGWIEDITLTYIVVKIWDLRRLIVPISYFIEKPFQNWTRESAAILATVFIYADYTVPVEPVRERLHAILERSGSWNRKAWGLQVTNATERGVELRALMSADDSPAAWDLRCEVREKLIAFIRQDYPESLPRHRVAVTGPMESGAGRVLKSGDTARGA